MNDIKLFDVRPDTLVTRLWDVLDTYEVKDTETTIDQVRQDLQDNPRAIINYLLTIIEEEI